MKTHCIIQGATAAALLVLLVLLVGCKEDEYRLRFSHYLHVTDSGMDCSDCHGDPGQPTFNAITHDTCLDCHEETEAENITTETCGLCHQEKQVVIFSLPELEEEDSVETSAVEDTPSRNVFVHTEALADQCTDCHEGLMDEALVTVPLLQRSDILSIREASHGSGQDCLTCHVDMDRAEEPASHDMAWMKRHGSFGIQNDASCSVCHSEDSCRECHSVMQPVNHNNIWRLRSHGVVAAWDRASCQVCHEEDSCSSCHAENRPRSHNARWGAPGFKPTHCIGCHDTSTPGDGCVTCHEGGNDVTLHERYWGGASFDHSNLTTESCYICHWTQTP